LTGVIHYRHVALVRKFAGIIVSAVDKNHALADVVPIKAGSGIEEIASI
jgi:hypothetical protein